MLDQSPRFDQVALACMIAQPIAILPGGEFYRSTMFKKYANVALREGIPTVTAQSISEMIGLLIVALIGTALIRHYQEVVVIGAVIIAIVWAYIRWQRTHRSHRVINWLPFVDISRRRLHSFLTKNRLLLSGQNFFILLFSSFISIGAGIAALYITAQAFGSHIDIFQASVAFVLPVILEMVTFLPGGLGVNEQGSVGILALFGVAVPMAVAITIMVRLFTLGMGFVYGFAAFAFARAVNYKEYN
jgi:uncharacterized protein (TIRG00374 family)